MGYLESFNELERWWDELRLVLDGEELIRAIEDTIAGESDPGRVEILNRFLAQEHAAQGNHAAAEAVFRRDPGYAILRWCQSWRRNTPEIDLVPVLEQRIRDETNPARLHALRFELATELQLRHDYAAAEAVMLADAAANPDEALPLISLADLKLYAEGKPQAALPFIDRAVEVAMRTGIFRRHALATKARVALELGDHAAIEDVLRRIMRLAFTRGNTDIGVERDILDRLPPGSIDAEVAQAYDEYCRKAGRTRTYGQTHVDRLVMRLAGPAWLKVARIIAEVLHACGRSAVDVNEAAVADSVRFLVEQGELDAQGDLAQWRHSEVRLAAAAQAAGDGPPGRPADGAGTVIASRMLAVDIEDGEVEVPVRIFLPVDAADHWRCDYEIGWPHGTKRGCGNGIDAVQALLSALQMVGVALYTSEAHTSGSLKWDEPGGGYGFPLGRGVRDLYQGRDKLM
jgi:hypothetical protein